MKNVITQFKNGFTLAEVLITLVIIGVVAAMTIPTLINNTKKQEYVSKLKKTYQTLAAATSAIIAEEGTPNASEGGWADTIEHIGLLYKKHLSYTKECILKTGCMEQNEIKYLNINNFAFSNINTRTDIAKFVLADGVQVLYDSISSNCVNNNGGSFGWCTRIIVDTNGAKKPNVFGRDVFAFVLKEQGLYPMGCDYNACSTVNTSEGYGCTCKVIREGAINY